MKQIHAQFYFKHRIQSTLPWILKASRFNNIQQPDLKKPKQIDPLETLDRLLLKAAVSVRLLSPFLHLAPPPRFLNAQRQEAHTHRATGL